MLERPDHLLHDANLDESELRARWWNLKGSALWSRVGGSQLRIDAFKKSSALFAKYAPQSDIYPTVLNNLAFEYQAAGDLNASIKTFNHALEVYGAARERDDFNIAGVQLNYGNALHQDGEFRSARAAFEDGERLALKTSGAYHGLY